MFFRRRNRSRRPAEQRSVYRSNLPRDHGIRAVLEKPNVPFLELELRSLTFRGAGFVAPAAYDVALHEGDFYDVSLWRTDDTWSVRTPAAIRRVGPIEDGRFEVGVEFVNLGDLYGQMSDGLGRLFNRRALKRVQPHAAQPVTASLYSHGHRMPGTVHDLTALGVGVVVDHVLAVPLRVDSDARVTLRLPGQNDELVGLAYIRQIRRLREKDVIGLEFDPADTHGFPAHAGTIQAYCEERERALRELDASVEQAA